MAELTFTGNKKLKTIAKEWCEKFPYTYLGFFDADGNSGMSWDTTTHGSIRGNKKNDDLSTNSNLKVSSFESRYEDAFGCKIEIKYEKNGKLYRTLNNHNELTLSEMNSWAKENGASNILENHTDWF
jgi:hypothetical protein